MGGSYPGNLAAWFRLKFPHLVVGALASSAPVLAASDFWQYDAVVSKSLGPQCSQWIQEAVAWLDGLIDNGGDAEVEAVKNIFHPSFSSTVKNRVAFMYILADIVAYVVQYGNPGTILRDRLCHRAESSHQRDTKKMTNNSNIVPDAVLRYANFTRFFFNYTNTTPREMDMTAFNSTQLPSPQENMRQW